jgi:hypothetical protein
VNRWPRAEFCGEVVMSPTRITLGFRVVENPATDASVMHAGLNNTVLVDIDGSFTGHSGGATIVPYNHELVEGDTRAIFYPDMSAYVVPKSAYRQLYFESQDPDRYMRRVQVRSDIRHLLTTTSYPTVFTDLTHCEERVCSIAVTWMHVAVSNY